MRWIDKDEQLLELVSLLEGAPDYYIDTEFESTRRATTLSVVQISTGDEVFLLDALSLTQLPSLGPVLGRSDACWVLHAGMQDVNLLLEALKIPRPPQLFDTQLAWAFATAEANVALSYLLYRVLGHRAMKSHQADDWMRRPLPPSQLRYAAEDIEHLPALAIALRAKLAELGRAESVTEVCAELLWPSPEATPALTLESFRHAWQLEAPHQAALKFLMRWCNELPAWERQRGPVPKTLTAIASRLPKTVKDLSRIKGVPAHTLSAFGTQLIRGLNEAAATATADDFEPIEPVPYATFEEIRLEAWLGFLRGEVSAKVQIAPELALPARLMRALKEPLLADPALDVASQLSGWRKLLLAEAVAQFAARYPAPGAPRD